MFAAESVGAVGPGSVLVRGGGVARVRRVAAAMVVAALAVALLAGALAHRAGTARQTAVPMPRGGLESMPLAARGPVAAALGRLEPAYRILGLTAVNPAQRLRAGFSPAGAAISSGSGHISVSLAAVGRGGALAVPAPVTPIVNGNRVTYASASLDQWFVNGPLGVEQGFDLFKRPAGSGPVTLAMRISGNLGARLSAGALLLTSRGVHLRYGDLVATDATGRTLHASLGLSHGRLLITVDDSAARYPLHVDPVFQQAQLTASGGAANDNMGWSVATTGNVVVVGAPNHAVNGNLMQGTVYVFVEPTNGWVGTTSPNARITSSDSVADDEFGWSVAISGNTIAVGAPYHAVGANAAAGAVYIYVKPATGTWASTSTPAAELTASDGAANDLLGNAVSISGTTVVSGAPYHTVGGNSGQGAAYVFSMPGGWTSGNQSAELTAGDGAAGDQFGTSVAVDGTTAAVGAPLHTVGANTDQGAAYVFSTDGTQLAELTASDGTAQDKLGRSIAISGGTIAAGAPDHAGGGAVYVFSMPPGGWASANENAELTASDGYGTAGLGHSVSISGNEIVAGAHFRNNGCALNQGALYSFDMPAGGWASGTQTAMFMTSNGAAKDELGDAVANAGSTIVGGAPFKTVGTTKAEGATYVFQSQVPPVANVTLPAISGGIHFGQTLTVTPGTWATPDTANYTYQWQRCVNGVPVNIAGATGTSYTLQKADETYFVTAVVTATDGEGQASAAAAQRVGPIEIQLPPSNTSLPTISGTLRDGQTVTASPGTWSSPVSLKYTYQFLECDSSGQNCKFGTVSTSPYYTATYADVGGTLAVRVVATDPQSQSAWARSAAVGPVAPPPPPSNVTAPSISGTAQDGQTLTANPGTWSSPDKLKYTYQWQRCDSTGSSCANIKATQSSYKATSLDVGHELAVIVTATDQEGQATAANASPVGPVAPPPPPSNTTAPSISGTPAVGQKLTASPGTWSSPDKLSYLYQWQLCDGTGANCTNVGGDTGTYTYTVPSSAVGDDVDVVVTAIDKEGQTGQATAAPVGPVT